MLAQAAAQPTPIRPAQPWSMRRARVTRAPGSFALGLICHSLRDPANRATFRADEAGYCARFGLDQSQRAALAARDAVALVAAGITSADLAMLARVVGLPLLGMEAPPGHASPS